MDYVRFLPQNICDVKTPSMADLQKLRRLVSRKTGPPQLLMSPASQVRYVPRSQQIFHKCCLEETKLMYPFNLHSITPQLQDLRSKISSFILCTFNSKLFSLHQPTRLSVSCKYTTLSWYLILPTILVSSANFTRVYLKMRDTVISI